MSNAQARDTRSDRIDWTTTPLGERVEYVCRLRGWSLNKLGEAAGLASGVMSRLARREATIAGAPDTLARVADAAGVSVVWLMLGRGPIELAEPVAPLRGHPDWAQALAAAKRRQRGIPDEFWEQVGDTIFPAPPQLDWQLLVGLVRELHLAHQRALEEGAPPAEASRPPPSPPPRLRAAGRAPRSAAKK